MRQSRIRTLFTFYSYFRARNIYTFAADRRAIRPFVNEKMPHEVRQKNFNESGIEFSRFFFRVENYRRNGARYARDILAPLNANGLPVRSLGGVFSE